MTTDQLIALLLSASNLLLTVVLLIIGNALVRDDRRIHRLARSIIEVMTRRAHLNHLLYP